MGIEHPALNDEISSPRHPKKISRGVAELTERNNKLCGLRPKGQKRTHAIAHYLISFSEMKHPLCPQAKRAREKMVFSPLRGVFIKPPALRVVGGFDVGMAHEFLDDFGSGMNLGLLSIMGIS
ncbi:hypothetical protein [Desulfosarcina ovata]|uniref:hypothetical protein n=1 Tax=Desulfosarcina ovata TaxID=83564 RepID=UPI0012D31CB3|nr:hypothetical protein [Desulfosarcina ovata]